MKKRHNLLLHAFFLVLVAIIFFTCNDEIEREQDSGMKGMNIIPNPMEIGQTISITGSGFKNVSAVVFPENNTTSIFEKVGDLQINVVVPAGTKSGGNITMESPDGNITIPINISLLHPEVSETYTASGAPNIGPNETLVIKGKDLINVSEIIFPGEAQATVGAMDFLRKGNEEIIVVVPVGTDKVVAPMRLKTLYGMEITSTPVDFTGGGYIPPEYLMLCGKEGKTWSWDEELADGMVFGNGGYLTNVLPAWWRLHISDLSGGVGSQDVFGAKMTFRYSYEGNIMTKTLVNGIVYEGNFKLDMTKKLNMANGNPWSIGRLEITGGDAELSIVGGNNSSRWGYPKGFDIIKLNDNELVLSFQYPDELATANFYVFRVKND